MRLKGFLGAFVMCVTIVDLGGCTTQTPTAANFTVRHFENGDRAVFLAAATTTMEETGYETSPGEPDAGRLVSVPRFNVAGDQPSGRASQISSKSLTRRIAEIRVEQPGDRVSAYCRVLVQEQTTRAHRMPAFDQSGSDSPAATPVEREAATRNWCYLRAIATTLESTIDCRPARYTYASTNRRTSFGCRVSHTAATS